MIKFLKIFYTFTLESYQYLIYTLNNFSHYLKKKTIFSRVTSITI